MRACSPTKFSNAPSSAPRRFSQLMSYNSSSIIAHAFKTGAHEPPSMQPIPGKHVYNVQQQSS